MNENLITFLYEFANFVVFALLLGWIFVKPIRKLLDEQAAKDAQLQKTAQQHLAEAAQLRQQLLDDRETVQPGNGTSTAGDADRNQTGGRQPFAAGQ